MAEYLDFFFKHLDRITAGVGLITYVLHLIWHRAAAAPVIPALSKTISSFGIPNGIAFLLCTFWPEYVIKMQGAFTAFLIGGLALVSLTFIDISKPKLNPTP